MSRISLSGTRRSHCPRSPSMASRHRGRCCGPSRITAPSSSPATERALRTWPAPDCSTRRARSSSAGPWPRIPGESHLFSRTVVRSPSLTPIESRAFDGTPLRPPLAPLRLRARTPRRRIPPMRPSSSSPPPTSTPRRSPPTWERPRLKPAPMGAPLTMPPRTGRIQRSTATSTQRGGPASSLTPVASGGRCASRRPPRRTTSHSSNLSLETSIGTSRRSR